MFLPERSGFGLNELLGRALVNAKPGLLLTASIATFATATEPAEECKGYTNQQDEGSAVCVSSSCRVLAEKGKSVEADNQRNPISGERQAGDDAKKCCQLLHTFLHGLTLELSRPTAWRRQRASVAHSTLLTPRCGVGLNELLGGGGCRCESSPGALAERRSGKA